MLICLWALTKNCTIVVLSKNRYHQINYTTIEEAVYNMIIVYTTKIKKNVLKQTQIHQVSFIFGRISWHNNYNLNEIFYF